MLKTSKEIVNQAGQGEEMDKLLIKSLRTVQVILTVG